MSELYRVMVDVTHRQMFGGQWAKYEQRTHRHDVIVWAKDDKEAKRLALAEFDLGEGITRRRIVKDSLVPIALDNVSRVLMQQKVTW